MVLVVIFLKNIGKLNGKEENEIKVGDFYGCFFILFLNPFPIIFRHTK